MRLVATVWRASIRARRLVHLDRRRFFLRAAAILDGRPPGGACELSGGGHDVGIAALSRCASNPPTWNFASK